MRIFFVALRRLSFFGTFSFLWFGFFSNFISLNFRFFCCVMMMLEMMCQVFFIGEFSVAFLAGEIVAFFVPFLVTQANFDGVKHYVAKGATIFL